MKLAIACCGTLLVLLSSCAKDKEPSPEILEKPAHAVLEGSIESNVLKIQNDPWATKCESDIRDRQIEMARDLDRRAQEIAALPISSASNDAKKVAIGSMTLIEIAKQPVKTPGWITDYSSWNDALSFYEKIKGTPTDSSWRSLNSFARGILLDDVYRVHEGYNYGLDKDSEPGLTLLREAIAKCVEDENCVEPDLSSAATFLANQPYYDIYTGSIKRRTEKAEKREMIGRFLRRVEVELKQYQFRKNEHMFRRDGDSFVLPLNAGAFTGFTAEIQAYIESAWSSALGKNVKVEWRDQESSPPFFRFLYHSTFGERAYVSPSDRTINLFPNSSNSTVAHEIGHVIGFRDTYYTIWDEKNCRYINQYREDDIMSQHQTGLVLPDHWQKLEQEYPL